MRRLRICTLVCLILVSVGVVRGDAGLLQVTEFRNQSLEAYPEIADRVVTDWTIPGLDAGFVPQGIAMIPDTDLVLLSGYRGLSYQARWIPSRRWPFVRRLVRVSGKQSVLILVRHPEGIPVRAGLLEQSDGEGVTWLNNPLAVVFEGGAYPYRTRWTRLEDRVLVLDLGGILE